jgi:hypothetical protein
VSITEITTGDHSKRADGRERARLGTAQCVFTIAVPYDFAVQPARQIEITRERLARIEGAIRRLAVAIRPARLVAGIRITRIEVHTRSPLQ